MRVEGTLMLAERTHWRQEDARTGTGWDLCPRQRRELESLAIRGSQETGGSSSGRIWWVEQRGRGDSVDGEDGDRGVSRLTGWQCPQGGEKVWSHMQGVHWDHSFPLPYQGLPSGLDPDLPGKEESAMGWGGGTLPCLC